MYKEVSRGINKSVHPHWWVTEMCGNQKALTYNILCIHQNQSKNFQISTSNSSISQVAFNSILDFLLRFGLFPNLRNKVKIMMMVFAYQRVSGFFCPPRGGQTVNQKTRSPAMYKPKNLSPGHELHSRLLKYYEWTRIWYSELSYECISAAEWHIKGRHSSGMVWYLDSSAASGVMVMLLTVNNIISTNVSFPRKST